MEWQRFVHNDKRGFTLIEVLFSLSICLLIILNTVPISVQNTHKPYCLLDQPEMGEQ